MGSEKGTPYQFFFFVYTPSNEETRKDRHKNLFENLPLTQHPVLYPLNRAIKFEKIWESLPNAFFHEEKIFYKDIYNLIM